jgi:hypothetical protein
MAGNSDMTRESWRRRLTALEEARKLQDGPLHLVMICFVKADWSSGRLERVEVDSTVAQDLNGFACHRNADEPLAAFQDRARDEYAATKPRNPAFLLFLKRESSDAAQP